MRATHSHGPFSERPYYRDDEIERIAEQELRSEGLLPSSPEPIRVERFIEKRFGVTPTYETLQPGILGFTRFGPSGVEEIVVSRALDDEGSKVAERRISTTLAHEAGHGLLHAHLFALGAFNPSLFGDADVSPQQVLCRDDQDASVSRQRAYDGRWWEFQANKLMGALLLPRSLVMEALAPVTQERGTLGVTALPADRRREAARLLSDIFHVNLVVGWIRADQLFPAREADQLTL